MKSVNRNQISELSIRKHVSVLLTISNTSFKDKNGQLFWYAWHVFFFSCLSSICHRGFFLNTVKYYSCFCYKTRPEAYSWPHAESLCQ